MLFNFAAIVAPQFAFAAAGFLSIAAAQNNFAAAQVFVL